MVSIALLMIEQAYDETTNALLKVAGEPILYHQIVQLRNFGIKDFIVAIEKVDARALHVATYLRGEGIEIEFISRLAALSDSFGRDDIFLMVSDGLWSSDKHIEDIMNANAPELVVFENDEKLSKFELIDLKYRWSGLAKLNGELLSSVESLPEDSAIHSTLLRLALQHDYALKVIEYAPSSLSKITEQSDANIVNEDYIRLSLETTNKRGFLENTLFCALANYMMRYVWKKRETQPALGYIIKYNYLLFFALAIVFAVFNFNITSYILGIIGCFSAFFKQVEQHIKPATDTLFAHIIINMSLLLIIFITAYHGYDLWSIVGAIIIFLLGYSIRELNFHSHYDRLVFSFSDILCVLILATLLGVQIYAIMAIAILYALWIFGGIILLGSQRP